MKFAAIIKYISDTEKIQSVRPLHRAYLTSLLNQGNIVATGPFTDGFGALIIYEAPDHATAESFIKNDPFMKDGIFISWDLHPWNCVMANRDLFPS
ncbi:MAG: hypothetical protein EBT92_14590 [Planctomycetes bacterium]|nr:hypothetical protein [Planctomycetota bacterium]NBY02348.1 hypothetical protein [Planctomycetota bacterium]